MPANEESEHEEAEDDEVDEEYFDLFLIHQFQLNMKMKDRSTMALAMIELLMKVTSLQF